MKVHLGITNSYMDNGIITNKVPLTYICASTVNIENNSTKGYPIIDGFSSTEFKSSQYGYIESVGYQCSYLFFSNGKDYKSLGGDLYIAIIHFENGFFKLDDIGVAKSKGINSKNKNLDLKQGMIVNLDSNDLESLDVEWLNNIIDK